MEQKEAIKSDTQKFQELLRRKYNNQAIKVTVAGYLTIDLKTIVSIVSDVANIPVGSILSKKRGSFTRSDARMVAIYLCFLKFKISKSELGRFFYRDRTTVIYAIKTVKDRITCNDPNIISLLKSSEKIIDNIKDNNAV